MYFLATHFYDILIKIQILFVEKNENVHEIIFQTTEAKRWRYVQRSESSFVQAMTCRLVSINQLPKSMRTNCWIDYLGCTSDKFNKNTHIFNQMIVWKFLWIHGHHNSHKPGWVDVRVRRHFDMGSCRYPRTPLLRLMSTSLYHDGQWLKMESYDSDLKWNRVTHMYRLNMITECYPLVSV